MRIMQYDQEQTKQLAEVAIFTLVTHLGISYSQAASTLLTEVARNLSPTESKRALASK
jgi:hypothetical protein